jgi:hypothetical protein
MTSRARTQNYRARQVARLDRLERIEAAARALVEAWRAAKETAGPLENLFRAVESGP